MLQDGFPALAAKEAFIAGEEVGRAKLPLLDLGNEFFRGREGAHQ